MKISNQRTAASSTKATQQSPAKAKKSSAKKKAGQGDGFDGVSGDMTQAQMLKKQADMQKESEMWQMRTNLLQAEHDMRKSIIANFRV